MKKKLRDAVLKPSKHAGKAPIPHCPDCDRRLIDLKYAGSAASFPGACITTAKCPLPCNQEEFEFCVRRSGQGRTYQPTTLGY